MAALTTPDRENIWAQFQRSNADPFGTLEKLDILAAVDALDDYLETNKGAIMATVPEPAQSGLSGLQIARLLTAIMDKRFKTGA